MTFSDTPPLPDPDVSRFVTYMTPEMQQDDDDGSDLPLPDLSTLILPAPDPPTSRSRPGKPLRETVVKPETRDEEFGDGVDSESLPESDASPEQPSDGADAAETFSNDSSEAPTRKRRRRRRRNRRRKRGAEGDSEQAPPTSDTTPGSDSPPAESSVRSEGDLQAAADSSATQEEPAGEAAPRKRRRRRRRRGTRTPSTGPSDASTGESNAPASDGTEA